VRAWEPPAPAVNKVYLYFNGHIVRLVFAEQGAPELPAFVRSAVAMNPGDALQMAKTIADFLKPWEAAQIKAQQAAGVEKKDG
jgi:hypothetical protein